VTVNVTALAVDMAGKTRELGKGSGLVGGGAVVLLSVPRDAVGPDEMLAFTYAGSDGTRSGDVFAPKPYKTYDLAPSGLTHTAMFNDGVWTLTIGATALAHYVSVSTDQPGQFSDNAFHLFPGHPATITFAPQNPGQTPVFTLRDLYSATTA
jgi:beta-mannosidase